VNDTGVIVDSTSENELVKLKGAIETVLVVEEVEEVEEDDEMRLDEDVEDEEADDPDEVALAVPFREPVWLDELVSEPETDVL